MWAKRQATLGYKLETQILRKGPNAGIVFAEHVAKAATVTVPFMERTTYSFALRPEDASQLSSIYGNTPPVTRLDSAVHDLIASRGVPFYCLQTPWSARPEAMNGLGKSGLDISTLHISAKPLADVSWQRQY